jgi:hypothetical protein
LSKLLLLKVGKWSTYRKRGGGAAGAPLLPAFIWSDWDLSFDEDVNIVITLHISPPTGATHVWAQHGWPPPGSVELLGPYAAEYDTGWGGVPGDHHYVRLAWGTATAQLSEWGDGKVAVWPGG